MRSTRLLFSAVALALVTACSGPAAGSMTGSAQNRASTGDQVGREPGAGAELPPEADPVERVRVEVPPGAPQRGPDDALVTIVVFSDLQCPFCARLVPTLDALEETYGARLRIVWRDLPLPFHDRAEPAAAAAREALAQQGPRGFWRMHDVLFENQRDLEREDLARYAAQLGLDPARFASALDSDRHMAAIDVDAADAARIGVRGTPTVFVNGRMIRGAQPLEVFVEIVNDELRRGDALVARGVAPSQLYALRMRGAREQVPEEEDTLARAAPGRRPEPDPAAVYRVPVDGAPVLGAAEALVTVVVFSDFQCPFCSRVLPTLEQIRDRYGDDVRIAFLHNPLPFHEHAGPAAEAAMEAFAQQGARGFWRMHDLLFANQSALGREDLERYAQQLGLEIPRFTRALDAGTHREAIAADQALAAQLGASGTPSFFINGRSLRGAQPLEAFTALIDEELVRARARVAGGTPAARVYAETIAAGATGPVMLEPEVDRAPPTAQRRAAPTVPDDVAGPPSTAQRTASGLASRVLRQGTGRARPRRDSRVRVHYSGWTTDGEMFDSSITRGEPATFPVSGVIPGFAEGLQLMVEGEVRRIWIPEGLAYAGRPGAPLGMLVFDVELIDIVGD